MQATGIQKKQTVRMTVSDRLSRANRESIPHTIANEEVREQARENRRFGFSPEKSSLSDVILTQNAAA